MIQRHPVDCWEYLHSIPDNFFQAIFTDPPYLDTINMNELRRVCRGAIIMFCAPLKPFFTPQYLCYWEKPPDPKNTSARIGQSNVEWILIENTVDTTYNPNLFWSNYTGVFHDTLLHKPVHPFEKPISLWERLMSIYADPNNPKPIFDPFMGSGSSLRAAQRCGLSAHGCENNPQWFGLSDDLE